MEEGAAHRNFEGEDVSPTALFFNYLVIFVASNLPSFLC